MVTFKQAVALLLTFSGVASAQVGETPAQDQNSKKQEEDLTNLNLEDLANIKVTTASRKAESLFGVASAISVVTAEDIKRSGAVNVPEALRMVPGVNVAQIGAATYAVSVRGFNNQFANRLLVLVDGRSVYNNLYGGVYWEDLNMSMEEIERIEVIRGPGGSLWGANAVNGIINIITKNAKDTQGTLLQAEAGSDINLATGTLRHGTQLGNGYFRLTAYGLRRGESTNPAGDDARDDWAGGRLSFRYDSPQEGSQKLMIQGSLLKHDRRTSGILPGPPPSVIPRTSVEPTTGSHLQAKLTQEHKDGSATSIQGFYFREHREAAFTTSRSMTFDFDAQHSLAPRGAHNIQFGIGYRYITDDYTSPFTLLRNPKTSFDTGTVYAQDDIQLGAKARLTLGTKVENNSFTGWEFQPSARLSLTPSEDKTYWFALSRVVQVPNRIDDNADIFLSFAPLPGGAFGEVRLFGQSNVVSGKTITAELGHRLKLSDRLTVEATAFHNSYTDLSTVTNGTPFMDPTPTPRLVIPLYFNNVGKGKSYGFELGAKAHLSDNWKLDLGYSFLDSDIPENVTAPKHQFQLLSTVGMGSKLSFDQAVYFAGDQVASDAKAYTRVDLQLRYRHSDSVEFAVGGRNLGNGTYKQIGTGVFPVNSVGPEAFVKATWKF